MTSTLGNEQGEVVETKEAMCGGGMCPGHRSHGLTKGSEARHSQAYS